MTYFAISRFSHPSPLFFTFVFPVYQRPYSCQSSTLPLPQSPQNLRSIVPYRFHSRYHNAPRISNTKSRSFLCFDRHHKLMSSPPSSSSRYPPSFTTWSSSVWTIVEQQRNFRRCACMTQYCPQKLCLIDSKSTLCLALRIFRILYASRRIISTHLIQCDARLTTHVITPLPYILSTSTTAILFQDCVLLILTGGLNSPWGISRIRGKQALSRIVFVHDIASKHDSSPLLLYCMKPWNPSFLRRQRILFGLSPSICAPSSVETITIQY